MWHLLQVVTRILVGFAGTLSLYAALFLYEDEQGRIQNKLEEWWVNLSDEQTKSLSKHAALMRAVAALAARSFDLLFTEKILSFGAFAVSACYSIASLCLFIVVTCAIGINRLWTAGFPSEVAALGAAVAVFGSLPALIRKSAKLMIAWYVVFFGMVACIALWSLGSWMMILGLEGLWSDQIESLYLPILIPLSFLFDVIFLSVTRWALRWCAGMDNAFKIVSVVLIDIALAMLLSVLPLRWGAYTLAELNSGDTLVCLVFVFLLFMLLGHRLLWPIINRTLYAFATRTGVRRSLFSSVGIVCLTYAGVPRAMLTKVLETLGG